MYEASKADTYKVMPREFIIFYASDVRESAENGKTTQKQIVQEETLHLMYVGGISEANSSGLCSYRKLGVLSWVSLSRR